MNGKIRYTSILFVDLILLSLMNDPVPHGYSLLDRGFWPLHQDHSFYRFVVDLTSITEDFYSVAALRFEAEYSLPGISIFHYRMPVLTVNGRAPPFITA